ncbi:MAG: OsmC family protein [Halobacteriaceae archaeon]
MTKHAQTVSEEGFTSTSEVNDFTIELDATGEEAPDTLDSLLATYGACYVPALRVAAEQRDAGELGRIEIEVTGELNDDDKLESVSFEIHLENELSEEKGNQILRRADQLCKIEDAVKPSLKAEKTFA